MTPARLGQPRRVSLRVSLSAALLGRLEARAKSAQVPLERAVEELVDVGLATERCRHGAGPAHEPDDPAGGDEAAG